MIYGTSERSSKTPTVYLSCQVMLVIGTSAVVQPAASMALEAKESGAAVAEITLEKTPHYYVMDVTLLGKAGEVFPRLVDEWT